ncbi:hypothetical protein [Spirosoma sp. KUDC1026]|uniref:hypothetical protein n=1 Tax=Spirosoma sp. KUDC1026 TaxID=2745947 RepID=UPI00159BC441|nr:hypothetical protein [Spirosoma sp. KUDC1026]QKZ12262.1 hypothetical protein HU175_06325 [Spirosoma sp. KUDC1026]
MFRRLPSVILFIFVGLIGIFVSAFVGLVYEFLQRPFSATNGIIWLFIALVSGGGAALIILFDRYRQE